jgi:phage terminase large subunit-like protein
MMAAAAGLIELINSMCANGLGVQALTVELGQSNSHGAFSAACERRRIKLVRGLWVEEFLDDLTAVPEVAHDNWVLASGTALEALCELIPF